jgi:hypothetical protein
MATRRGRGPLTWRAPDQGLRLVDSRGREPATLQLGVFAGPGEPSDCQLSLQGTKSSTEDGGFAFCRLNTSSMSEVKSSRR